MSEAVKVALIVATPSFTVGLLNLLWAIVKTVWQSREQNREHAAHAEIGVKVDKVVKALNGGEE